MTVLLTNIDDVRAEIMRLENALVFDQTAWAQVLIALSGSPCRRADAARRMETARGWQKTPAAIVFMELVVAVETEVLA